RFTTGLSISSMAAARGVSSPSSDFAACPRKRPGRPSVCSRRRARPSCGHSRAKPDREREGWACPRRQTGGPPMFLRSSWYVAGWSHHFKPGELVARTVLGERIVLYRTSGGAVAALEDRCCHRLAPLSRGRLEGDDLRCMYHGMKFSAEGRC